MEPYYLLWVGQSNAKGGAEVPAGFLGTSIEVESGVKVWDYYAKAFVLPQWGDTPLSTLGANNAGVRCANAIKRKTGRDVYLIVSAFDGLSIENWLGTNSRMWSQYNYSILPQVTESLIPRIDAVGWMQGEADHDTAGGNYNTYELYREALETVIAQLRALPQWTTDTQFVTSGVGEWFDMLTFGRNDVLLTLNEWGDPHIGNISTQGCTRNPDVGQNSHFSHDSLTLVGERMATRFLNGNTGDMTVYTGGRGQGARLPFAGKYIGGTVTINPADLKGGAYLSAANSTINLPNPKRFDGATVIVDVTSFTVNQPVIVNMTSTGTMKYANQSYNQIICNIEGQWVFQSFSGVLHLVSKPHIIDEASEFLCNGITKTLNTIQTDTTVWRLHDSVIKLPDPTGLTNMEVSFIAYSVTGGYSRITVDGLTGKMYNKTGNIVDYIDLASAGNYIKLRAVNTRWLVECSNF